jgi:hypothetical protein
MYLSTLSSPQSAASTINNRRLIHGDQPFVASIGKFGKPVFVMVAASPTERLCKSAVESFNALECIKVRITESAKS